MKNLCHNCEKPSSAPICRECVAEQNRMDDWIREEREDREFAGAYGWNEWDNWAEFQQSI